MSGWLAEFVLSFSVCRGGAKQGVPSRPRGKRAAAWPPPPGRSDDGDPATRPPLLVTATVEAIQLSSSQLSLQHDMAMRGRVAWTGTSSMDIRMELEQVGRCWVCPLGCAGGPAPAPAPRQRTPAGVGGSCLLPLHGSAQHAARAWVLLCRAASSS